MEQSKNYVQMAFLPERDDLLMITMTLVWPDTSIPRVGDTVRLMDFIDKDDMQPKSKDDHIVKRVVWRRGPKEEIFPLIRLESKEEHSKRNNVRVSLKQLESRS